MEASLEPASFKYEEEKGLTIQPRSTNNSKQLEEDLVLLGAILPLGVKMTKYSQIR